MCDSDSNGPVETVIASMKAGNEKAFEIIMVRHQTQVIRTAWRLSGNLQDAQDAAQEVFFRLYRYRRRVDESRDLKPWLYRLTVNVCRDMARKSWRKWIIPLETIHYDTIPAEKSTERDVSLAELQSIMAEGLKKLSIKEREALVLRDIEGLSTANVAEVLRSSETTVRSQISRARVKMKKFRDKHIGKDT